MLRNTSNLEHLIRFQSRCLGSDGGALLRHLERGWPQDLAEWSGIDRVVFRARLHGAPEAYPGDLSKLASELGLSGEEGRELAMAYAYELDSAHEVGPVSEEDELTYLTERVGLSPEEAARVLEDADLFTTNPGSHYAFESEEAVRVWGEAERKLDHLAQAEGVGSVFDNLGVEMLLFDAASRATELRKRAEERTIEASAE